MHFSSHLHRQKGLLAPGKQAHVNVKIHICNNLCLILTEPICVLATINKLHVTVNHRLLIPNIMLVCDYVLVCAAPGRRVWLVLFQISCLWLRLGIYMEPHLWINPI